MGSDGHSFYNGKLYACYAPQVFNKDKLKEKFDGDLAKAKAKRDGQFEIFVFVHNERRGMHPQVSSMVAQAAVSHKPIKFENFGFRRFRDEFMRLDRSEVEDILQVELPVSEMTYGLGLDEIRPLMGHLADHRIRPDVTMPLEIPSDLKLDYNDFSEDTRHEVLRFLHLGAPIDAYYQSRIDVTERDEVAAAFGDEYRRLRTESNDPEHILWRLEQYILGNESKLLRQHNAAKALLAYFFQTCDIFDNPPKGWVSHKEAQVRG
jgi:hypothetical protein